MRLRLDVAASSGRYTIERDLDAGTLRVVDRDRGEDRTAEFLRGGGRDAVGEKLTGLTEPLFRTTAYVGQNVLDGDALVHERERIVRTLEGPTRNEEWITYASDGHRAFLITTKTPMYRADGSIEFLGRSDNQVKLRGHRIELEGEIPSAAEPPSGCVFHTRCPRKLGPICEQEDPPCR